MILCEELFFNKNTMRRCFNQNPHIQEMCFSNDLLNMTKTSKINDLCVDSRLQQPSIKFICISETTILAHTLRTETY